MGRRLHITDAHLRAAYVSRRTPGWPPTFEAAMADALISRLVRSTAIQAALAEQRRRRSAVHRRPLPAPAVDLKRRAAGDSDD